MDWLTKMKGLAAGKLEIRQNPGKLPFKEILAVARDLTYQLIGDGYTNIDWTDVVVMLTQYPIIKIGDSEAIDIPLETWANDLLPKLILSEAIAIGNKVEGEMSPQERLDKAFTPTSGLNIHPLAVAVWFINQKTDNNFTSPHTPISYFFTLPGGAYDQMRKSAYKWLLKIAEKQASGRTGGMNSIFLWFFNTDTGFVLRRIVELVIQEEAQFTVRRRSEQDEDTGKTTRRREYLFHESLDDPDKGQMYEAAAIQSSGLSLVPILKDKTVASLCEAAITGVLFEDTEVHWWELVHRLGSVQRARLALEEYINFVISHHKLDPKLTKRRGGKLAALASATGRFTLAGSALENFPKVDWSRIKEEED